MIRSRRQFIQSALSSAVVGPALDCCGLLGQQIEQVDPSVQSLVGRARHLGSQFLDNSVGVTGMDGATSTVLPSGKSLWLFGDTVEGPFKSIHGLDLARLRSNTAAIVRSQDPSQGIRKFDFLTTLDGKRPRQIVPFSDDEDPAVHRIWAIHGSCSNEAIYLFYHRITLLKGVDVFANFQLDGMGIARGNTQSYEFTRLRAPDGSREFWKGDQPSFGVFVERAGDHVYLWGCLQTAMYLARTRVATIEELSSYEYLAEAPNSKHPTAQARWSKKFEPTAPLFDSVPNEMSAAYNPHLRCHVAFHALNREHKIVMRMAPEIIGPWSEGEIVFRPKRIADGDLIYAAKEHPELARQGGRVVYVTFVNSTTYVPQLVELTLK
jgi:Domain of unknown function (DUF4185)